MPVPSYVYFVEYSSLDKHQNYYDKNCDQGEEENPEG